MVWRKKKQQKTTQFCVLEAVAPRVLFYDFLLLLLLLFFPPTINFSSYRLKTSSIVCTFFPGQNLS